MNRFYTRRNINIGLAVFLAVISFFAWYTYQNMKKARQETKTVNETLRSLKAVGDLMDDMQDIESGHRGYLISANKRFLQPYYAALERFQNDTVVLKELLQSYPERGKTFRDLLVLFNRKADIARLSIHKMEIYGYDSAAYVVQSGQGREIMDSIRLLVWAIMNKDRQDLSKSNADREIAATNTAKLFIVLAGIFILILYILYRRITRELKYREEYESRITYMANLVEKTSDAIISTDTGGLIQSWNKGAEKLYGYTQGEAIGKLSAEITRSGISESRAEELRSEIRSKGSLEMEAIHMNKKGDEIYCHISISPLFNDNGGISGYVAVIRDITQRKHAEKLLLEFNNELAEKVREKTDEIRQSEEKLHHILTSSIDDFYVIDRNYSITLINNTAKKNLKSAWGKTVDLGANVLDLIPPAKRMEIKKNFDYVFTGEKMEYEVDNTGNDIRGWILVNYMPVFDEKNSVTGAVVVSKNITKRKQAEDELKQINNRFEMISRTTNDAVWEWDLVTGKLWSNETHQHLYGLKLSDPVPTEEMWAQRIHPDDRDAVVETQRTILATDKNVFISEYRFYTEEEGYRDLYDRCYIVRDKEGRPVRMMGSMMDITERKRAEAALRESEQRYRSLIEQASDFIMITDQKGNFIDANSNFCKTFGYTKEEIVKLNINDLIDPEQLKSDPVRFDLLISGQNILRERRMMHRNGTIIEVEANVKLLPDGRILAIARDIRERKNAELAIRTSEETRKLIMNSALDAIVCINTEGIITVWTPQAEIIFGWKENEILGKSLADTIIPHRHRETYRNGIAHYLKTREQKVLNRVIEISALNSEGKEFPVELSITHIRQGDTEFFCGFVRDITQRKRAESEIKESEEKYRALVENAPEALVVMDMEEGRFISVSESAVKLFKMSKEELLKIGPVEVSPEFQPDGKHSSEAAMDRIKEAIAGWKPNFEWTHCDRYGKPITCEVWLVRLPSEKGILIRGSIVDIGERKKAEKELLESEAKFRAFFENSLDGILLTSPEGNILSANPAACQMFGMTEEEIISAGREGLLDTSDPKLSIILEERRRKGKAFGELTCLRKDRTPFPAEISSAIFIDAFGQERTSMIIRDITDRKRAEEEIIKTNARFNTLSKATSDIVWDWDLFNNSLWWNENYYSILGFEKQNDVVHAEDWYSHIHPDDVNRVRENVQKTFAGSGTVWRDEYRYAKADGTYLHFLDRGFIMRDKYGTATRMIGSMADMTPIYNAQREVAESENRLRTILDTDPECIKLMGSGCQLYEINKGGLEMLEAENFEQIKGQSILPVVAESQQKAVAKLIDDAFKGQSGGMEFEMTTLKGNKRWCALNVVPFRNSEGEITYALGVTLDISEKKKAEIELKQNEEKYRTLVEQAVDAIALYDEKGRILDVNTGSSVLLGYSKDELANMYLTDILLPEEIIENPIRYDVLQTGRSTVKQRRMKRKDGTIVETEVRSQQLPDGRFLSVTRDMTERIRTEEELKTSYKAIRKLTAHLQNIREEERTNIAREIHDELGQQLTVLKMDVSWINKKILPTSDESTKEKMKELLSMLDDTVKTVRRISSELRPSLLDDLGLVAAMEWQLKEFEKRSGIKTKLESPEKEIKLSNTIKTALFRIFQESLTNVARHSQAKNISVSLEQKNNSFVLSIADDGKGFDKKKLAERRTLGILGMNERTTMIGGSYEIVSVPEKGTKVSVSVPMNERG